MEDVAGDHLLDLDVEVGRVGELERRQDGGDGAAYRGRVGKNGVETMREPIRRSYP